MQIYILKQEKCYFEVKMSFAIWTIHINSQKVNRYYVKVIRQMATLFLTTALLSRVHRRRRH